MIRDCDLAFLKENSHFVCFLQRHQNFQIQIKNDIGETLLLIKSLKGDESVTANSTHDGTWGSERIIARREDLFSDFLTQISFKTTDQSIRVAVNGTNEIEIAHGESAESSLQISSFQPFIQSSKPPTHLLERLIIEIQLSPSNISGARIVREITETIDLDSTSLIRLIRLLPSEIGTQNRLECFRYLRRFCVDPVPQAEEFYRDYFETIQARIRELKLQSRDWVHMDEEFCQLIISAQPIAIIDSMTLIAGLSAALEHPDLHCFLDYWRVFSGAVTVQEELRNRFIDFVRKSFHLHADSSSALEAVRYAGSGFHRKALILFKHASYFGDRDLSATNIGLILGSVGRNGGNQEFFDWENKESGGISRPLVAWPFHHRRAWPHYKVNPAPPSSPDEELPRISVIIPNLNYGEFLEEAILSVINQDYPNLELIVIDGGSTDHSLQVIEQYASRLFYYVSESDSGQSEAINKGIKACRGDLITWLNSDDMLAPGAPWTWARSHRDTNADIIVGSCLVHRDYEFTELRTYGSLEEDFTIDRLTNISEFWLKGRYPYQPEVIFSRSLWERAGGQLDVALELAMDYDLWLRFAQLSPRISICHAATALFRLHSQNKTKDLSNAILEQAKVRSRLPMIPWTTRAEKELLRKLNHFFQTGPRKVSVISSQVPKSFSESVANETTAYFRTRGFAVQLSERIDPATLIDGELIIVLVNVQLPEWEALPEIRKACPNSPVIGWFWDNHHQLEANLVLGSHFDAITCCHHFASLAMAMKSTVLLPSIPACVTQWSREEAELFFLRNRFKEKNNQLFGEYVYHGKSKRRDRLIHLAQECTESENLRLIDEAHFRKYLALSREEKFKYWAANKISLIAPVNGELSQRFFETLVVGLIPLIPADVSDVDEVDLGDSKRYVTFDGDDAGEINRACAEANEVYTAKRSISNHIHSINNHMFVHRIDSILTLTKRISEEHRIPPSTGYFQDRLPARYLVVELQYGLGNRMRALASAFVVANLTGRQLVPIWYVDYHMGCRFAELFKDELGILEKTSDTSLSANEDLVLYDYTLADEAAMANFPAIETLTNEVVWIRSPRVLKTLTPLLEKENEFLRSLHPVDFILKRLESVRLADSIGLHIRSEPAECADDTDVGADETGNFWREKSTHGKFATVIEDHLERNPSQRFFIACDQPEICNRFHERFGDRMTSLPSDHLDESKHQLYESFADIIALSQCSLIYGSNWNSLTEYASRLGGKKLLLAGIDF